MKTSLTDMMNLVALGQTVGMIKEIILKSMTLRVPPALQGHSRSMEATRIDRPPMTF